jgi:hypothetical protein
LLGVTRATGLAPTCYYSNVRPRFPFSQRFLPVAALAFLLAAGFSFALPPLAVTGTLGIQSRPDFVGSGFGYNLAVYNRFDEQVLIGVQSGQGIADHPTSIPILAAGFMRLPFGRVFVPAATGGIGYALGSGDGDGFIWRGGGLLDIRNGRRSSLLLGCEYEGFAGRGGLVVRGGLLLEL